MDGEEDEFDVIIIGGGVSGLCAAFQIWKKDPTLRVAVLEAKERAGGRTCRGEIQGVNGPDTWDLGGQWIGRCQPHIMELLTELGLETVSEYTAGKKVVQLGDNKVHTYSGDIPALPWYALVDLQIFITRASRLIRDVDPNDPSLGPDAEKWDNTTFEDVKNSMLWTKAARAAVDISGRCIFGVEPSEMSALYYLMYASAAGGFDPLISSEKGKGGQEMKIKDGAFSVSQALVKKIGEDKVILNQPVTAIIQDDSGVTVQTLGGSGYRCQRVIVALPPHQQAKIEYSPSLPVEKLNVLHRMPAGNITKVIVTYRTSFWRAAGYSGEGVTAGGSSVIEGFDHGPLCIVFDGVSPRGSPALVSFIGGKQQIQYSKLKAEDRKRAVLHNLSELFGKECLDPIEYREKNWNDEPYNHGGPVSVATPGIITKIVPGLRKPYGRLHFAGTESATVWCGFINGAVQTGYRAANEVLYNVRPQVITSNDLDGTAYDSKTRKPPAPRGRGRILRWTVTIGILAGLVYAAKWRGLKLSNFGTFLRSA